MRLHAIDVTGLFGIFNHYIPVSQSDRVTIIHGPNGFGKTVILQMVASLINGDAAVFEHVPFAEFSLQFEDRSRILVKRGAEGKSRETKGQQRAIFSRLDARGQVVATGAIDVFSGVTPEVLNRVDAFVPPPYHRAGGGWRGPDGEFISLADVLRKYPQAAEALPSKLRNRRFTALSQELPVFFVETKRIYADDDALSDTPMMIAPARSHRYPYDDDYYLMSPGRVRPRQARLRVDQYSVDVAHRINTTLADYAKNSQESDRTFPERLVRFIRNKQQQLPAREILDQMNQLEAKRQRLVTLGFLDSDSGLRDLTEDDVIRAPEALTIYVGDVHAKLKVFDDLSQRVGTLIDVLNARFTYKHVAINRDVGFFVATDAGEQVALADLSSGEQHELIVLYELLFRAPSKGLVLVDEPEISLHVGWQSRFLHDLIDILNITDSQAIVATHSPLIIGPRWDLTVDLRGPEARPHPESR